VDTYTIISYSNVQYFVTVCIFFVLVLLHCTFFSPSLFNMVLIFLGILVCIYYVSFCVFSCESYFVFCYIGINK
jgi:hypothetical protein